MRWYRDATRQVTSVLDAERLVEQVGFADGLTPAGTIALSRRVRASRCRSAAQRADRPGNLAGVDTEGRHRPARQGVLRQAVAWKDDVHRAADGAVLPCRLGGAAVAGTAA